MKKNTEKKEAKTNKTAKTASKVSTKSTTKAAAKTPAKSAKNANGKNASNKLLAKINSKYFILVTIISAILALIASFIPNINVVTYPFALICFISIVINFVKEKERFKSFNFTVSFIAVFICFLSFFFAIMTNFSMLGSFSRFINSVIGNNVAPIEINIDKTKYFGESIAFDDKITLKVTEDQTFIPSENATFLTGDYINFNPAIYECKKYKITIKNESENNYNLSYFTASLISGGENAERIFDSANNVGFINQILKTNSSATFYIAFCEKTSTNKQLTVKISPKQFSLDNVIYSNKPAKDKKETAKK